MARAAAFRYLVSADAEQLQSLACGRPAALGRIRSFDEDVGSNRRLAAVEEFDGSLVVFAPPAQESHAKNTKTIRPHK